MKPTPGQVARLIGLYVMTTIMIVELYFAARQKDLSSLAFVLVLLAAVTWLAMDLRRDTKDKE